MFFSKLMAVAVGVATVVSGASYPIPGTFTGMNGKARPQRRNINDLKTDYFAFGLYIQALKAFQATPTNQEDGWFQICGIHGRPYIAWDGSQGPGGVHYNTGYCEHDSVLFPTWHRPYLALFEQRIHYYATQIANKAGGTDGAHWRAVAATLRIPYWDWAANHNIPDVVASQKITVKVPSTQFATGSAWVTMDNPLYTYKMGALDKNLFPPSDPNDGNLAKYSFTVRQPSSSAANAASNDGTSNTALSRLNLKGNIYNLLTANIAYYQMASQANPGISLESIHGNVHVAVGGNGHMTQLGYAAFDPIFWLHHANCDRMFAIWQSLNPTKWIAGGGEPASWTWTNAAGSGQRDYSNTGLSPFSQSAAGNHWTSDSSRSLAAFGYTYPEINDWSQSAAQLKTAVTASVNKLYGPSSGPNKRRQVGGSEGEGATQQWYAAISVSKTALPTGFTISVFLGAPPADSSTWLLAPNLAGALSVFPPPSGLPMTGSGMSSYTELALDSALQAAGYVDSDATSTAAYLATNLSWRVRANDAAGTVVDPATIPSLNVTVYEKNVTVSNSVYTLPTYSNTTTHPEITKGKKGGGNGHGGNGN